MVASRRTLAVLAALFVMGAVLAASGCLDSGDDDDDKKLVIPDDRKGDKMVMTGDVDQVTEVTIEEIVAMGLVDFEATFVNSVGTTFTANYSGVLLSDLLDLAGPSDDADILQVQAGDGYKATLYLGDVDDTTYMVLREEKEWNDIDDAGVFRIVDTDLPSTYWVRDVEALNVVISQPIWSGGYTDERWLLDVGWIKEHASREVSWTEGEKTRTYNGVPMDEVLTAVGADETITDTLSLGTMDKIHEPVDLAVAREKGVLLVDSRGDYVYYQGPEDERVDKVSRFYVGTLVSVGGEVGDPYTMDVLALSDNDQIDVPMEVFNLSGVFYLGTPLSWLVAHAAPDPTADAVQVIAGDGYSAVFPLANLSSAVLAFMTEEDEPLAIDLGPLRILDGLRPGPFHVGWVVEIRVFTSEPLAVSGVINETDAISLASIDAQQDTTVTYNDGKKDRTYPALTWDRFLDLLDADMSTATHLNVTNSNDDVVTWDMGELLGNLDAGICVDSSGRFMAVYEELGDYVFDVVSIEVG
jgi:DMSO/TMAO reductase YedYZ molybdopterin-dependent catalytic subunit